jgi:hypothetical protein
MHSWEPHNTCVAITSRLCYNEEAKVLDGVSVGQVQVEGKVRELPIFKQSSECSIMVKQN